MNLFFILFIPFLFITSPQAQEFMGLSDDQPMLIDEQHRTITLLAEFRPGAFSGRWKTTPNYHAVVWKKGRAAREALFVARVDDRTFHRALETLGATPGNNLNAAVWDYRKNKNRPEPDTRIEGTPVEVSFWWPGLPGPLPLDSLLHDPGGRGFDFRFGGNLAMIPKWKSGCIVCLYSCPGSKVGNYQYTVRDYVQRTTHFQVRPEFAGLKKKKAVLIFKIKR